jgi:hypothetical protein
VKQLQHLTNTYLQTLKLVLMSHFSTILTNLVASGMTNTNAALVVLESFFEQNDRDSSNLAVQYRGNIADTNTQIATGLITEKEAQVELAKVKKSTLELINTVDELEFDDEIVINYFAMLTPNPAKDPFFSPIASEEKPEEYPEDKIMRELEEQTQPAVAALPQSEVKKPRSKQFGLTVAAGVIALGGLIYFILPFSQRGSSRQSDGFSQTTQAQQSQQTAVNQKQTQQTQPTAQPPAPYVFKQEERKKPEHKPNRLVQETKPSAFKPLVDNKAVKPPVSPPPTPPKVVPTLTPQIKEDVTPTPTVDPKSVTTKQTEAPKKTPPSITKSLPEKKTAPDIKPISVRDRDSVKRVVRNLLTPVKKKMDLK